jgi:hypothetical protein
MVKVTASQRVQAHLERVLGMPARFSTARGDGLPVPFRIATYIHQPANDAVTLVTIGMSETCLGSPPVRQELLLCTWKELFSESLYDSLFRLGHELQSTATAAYLGSIVELPAPIFGGGSAHMLVYTPTYFDADLYMIAGADPIRIVWLIPVTAAEADLVLHDGVRALEVRFEENDPDLLDLEREGVV